MSTNLSSEFHLTVLLRGRLGFSNVGKTYATTLWGCQLDTLKAVDAPDFIPLSEIPEQLVSDNSTRFSIVLTGPVEDQSVQPSELPLREFSLKNFSGNRSYFFGVDCMFSDLRKLGSLRNAMFKEYRFRSRDKTPHQFLIFDPKEKEFRELLLPAMINKDSTFRADFNDLPFTKPPVYFNLKPYDSPQVRLSAKLSNGEEVHLGKMGGRCREDELVQHPIVSRPVTEYRKFLRYFVDRTEYDYSSITRLERSPFLDDFNFAEIEYRPVEVVALE